MNVSNRKKYQIVIIIAELSLYMKILFIASYHKLTKLFLTELDGKTAKMYRGGKICMTDHFKPLWLVFLNLDRFYIFTS